MEKNQHHELHHELGSNVGQELATIITEKLEGRLNFEDDAAEFQTLEKKLNALRDIKIDINVLAHSLDEAYWAHYSAAENMRMRQHETHLNAGNILIETDGLLDWTAIHPSHKSTFKATFQQIDEDHRTAEIDENEPHHIDQQTLSSAEELLIEQCESFIDAINIEVPKPRNFRMPSSRVGRVMLRLSGMSRAEIDELAQPYSKTADVNHTKVARKVRKLSAWITEFMQNPYDAITEVLITVNDEEITQQAAVAVDEEVAKANTVLFNRLPMPEQNYIREETSPKVKKRTQPKKPIMQRNNETPEITHDEKVGEITLEDAGLLDMHTPWLPEKIQNCEITKVILSGVGKAYITRSIHPRLQEISDTVRQKSNALIGYENLYDTIAYEATARIASGLLPHRHSNMRNMRKVRYIKPTSAYNELSIWYPVDVTPNAPRVYFTYKSIGEMAVAGQDLSTYDTDTMCVVILAETDKANQVATLKVLTDQTHTQLRSGGAGSI